MAEKGVNVSEVDVKSIARALGAPFDETEVKFKPQAVKGNRALALAYVDVRAIMDRLDNVLGVENWQDHYQLLPDNSVMCRLRLRIGDRWITKTDVGGPSEQPDGGDQASQAGQEEEGPEVAGAGEHGRVPSDPVARPAAGGWTGSITETRPGPGLAL